MTAKTKNTSEKTWLIGLGDLKNQSMSIVGKLFPQNASTISDPIISENKSTQIDHDENNTIETETEDIWVRERIQRFNQKGNY